MNIFKKRDQEKLREDTSQEENSDDSEIEEEETRFFSLLSSKIKEIAEFLSNNSSKEMNSSMGRTIRPLGEGRLKSCEIILLCIKLDNTPLNHEIKNQNIFKILMVNLMY